MSVASIVARGRRAAEALMVDTVTVERQTGTTMDPNTLAEVPVLTEIYEGRGRVQRPGGSAARDDVSGATEFGLSTVLVQLPLSATGVLRGDRVSVTAIGATTDPDLFGLVATVQTNLTKTHPTKRTLVCEEVS